MIEKGAHGKRGRLGRADLLDCFAEFGEEGVARAASFYGFDLPEEEGKKEHEKSVPFEGEQRKELGSQKAAVKTVSSSGGSVLDTEPQHEDTLFWRAIRYRLLPEAEKIPEKVFKPLSGAELEPVLRQRKPAKPPLMPWPRLWPFLRTALGEKGEGRTVDWRRTVNDLARNCKPLKRLPRLRRRRWSSFCQLIIDRDDRNASFFSDFCGLTHQVRRMRGSSGLDLRIFCNGPHRPCWRGEKHDLLVPYRKPEPGTPILVLSDLGCFDGSGRSREAWLDFGRMLRRAGFTPVALTPAPPRLWEEEMTTVYRLAVWDRAVRVPRFDKPEGKCVVPKVMAEEEAQQGLLRLMSLLSALTFIEPELLRALRLLLPRHEVDAGMEAEAWLHKDTLASLLGFSFTEKFGMVRRQAFRQEPKKLRLQVSRLVKKYRTHLPLIVRVEEELILSELLGRKKVPASLSEALARASRNLENTWEAEAVKQWVERLEKRLHPAMWKYCRELAVLWANSKKEEFLQKGGSMELPPGLDLGEVAWVFGQPGPPREWQLWQMGESLDLLPAREESLYECQIKMAAGSSLAGVTLRGSFFQVRARDGEPGGAIVVRPAREGRQRLLELEQGPVVVKTDVHETVLDTMDKPRWADALGRDHIGLYAEFVVQGVRHRLRWIPPGRFMMGSPEGEAERGGDEKLHEVVLAKGYWLGETVCTQELWQAVMGANPSGFSGEKRPVENVSWQECQVFLKKVNRLVPGLDLRLPTEAEWEYACRAGTVTPFSFGENITTDQANYDGNLPYADGKKGEYKEETVDVKSYPANAWGLHEMHGNVLEWCRDRYGHYPDDLVVDPQGASGGERRVLRGGSWFDGGGSVRSACRHGGSPSDRVYDFGFRLARGQKASQQETGAGPDSQSRSG